MLLADALLPGVFARVLSVAVGGVEDPARQWDGLGRQLFLGDAALPQVGFGGHGRWLGPAVGDVVRAVSRDVVVGGWPMSVAVKPRVAVSVRVRVRVGCRVAVMEGPNRVHGVDFRSAVVHVQIGRGQVLIRGGPQVTGKRLQGVVPDGTRIRILTSKVTLAQRGDSTAGAA